MGELWRVCCEDLGENWQHHKGTHCVWCCIVTFDIIVIRNPDCIHDDDIKWKNFLLLALCAGNPLVTSGFSSQRPVTWRFDIFFDLCLNKHLSKLSRLEISSRSLWCYCNVPLNSLRPGDAYMCQGNGSVEVQMIPCDLFIGKPLWPCDDTWELETLIINVSGNGLSLVQHQAFPWSNGGIL